MFELTTMNLITDFITPERISLAVRVILILIVGIPVVKIVLKILSRMIKDKLSLQSEILIARTVKYLLYLIVAVMVLNEFGFKISALLGAAGIFGIAIGFASQTSVSNIISGIFLISEKPFMIGDVVEVGGNTGVIENIGLLSAKLKTFDGRSVRIPNETMIKNDVTNFTKYEIRRAQFVIGIAYKEDIRKVLDLLAEIADNIEGGLKEPAPLIAIDQFADSAVNINFGVWTDTPNAVPLRTQLMLAVKERFDKEGIEIPFPHVSIYAGEASEPLKIQYINKGVENHEQQDSN